MQPVVILLFGSLCGLAYGSPQYTTKYDNIDIDEIFHNERLLKNYYQCLEGTKSCTKDGQELKDILPDALKTKCSKCNETQKNGAEKIIRFLIDNKADWFKNLESIYDPEGIYKKNFEQEAKQKGIELP